MRLAPELTLGAYEIIAPLGADGMVEVHRARGAERRRAAPIGHNA